MDNEGIGYIGVAPCGCAVEGIWTRSPHPDDHADMRAETRAWPEDVKVRRATADEARRAMFSDRRHRAHSG
jgi:hypothetical protein